MMKVLVLVLMMLLATAALVAPSMPVNAQSGCGLKPLKPLIPLGCKDVVAQCTCDNRGKNCHWEWICVPR